MKKIAVIPHILLSITVFTFLILLTIPVFAQEATTAQPHDPSYVSGKVLEIVREKDDKELEDNFKTEQKVQTVKVLVLTGKHKGETIITENNLTSSPIYDINIHSGQRVVLSTDETSSAPTFFIADIERYPVLMIVLGVFLELLLLIGGKKGMNTIISLAITAALVFFALIPAILHNYPPIPSALAVAFISTFLTMALVSGINMKSLAAYLGIVFSVLIAGAASLLVIHFASLNGFHDQESAMLWLNRPNLDFTGILAASIIISTLGIVISIATTVSDKIYELKESNSNITRIELIKSGINSGRDTAGMLANALILTYIGGALSLILLASDSPILKLINLNSVATEIAIALAGSIGIVLCVPITAVISGYLIGKNNDLKPTCVCENEQKVVLR